MADFTSPFQSFRALINKLALRRYDPMVVGEAMKSCAINFIIATAVQEP